MKNFIRILIITLALFTFASSISLAAETGTCGDAVSWTLDNGVLTISGSGKMNAFSTSPWAEMSVTSVIIEDGITSIGAYAFYECDEISEVSIPDTVTSIGSSAFRKCNSLTQIELSENIQSVATYAFAECEKLENILVNKNNSRYSSLNGVLYKEGFLLAYPAGKKDSSYKTAITGCVSKVLDGAFYGCKNLESVEISGNIKTVGESLFYNCTNLKEVTLSHNLEAISESMFENCTSLTGIKLPTWMTEIGRNAFRGCKNLESISLSDNISEISNTAFSGCEKLSIRCYENSVAHEFAIENSIDYTLMHGDGEIFCVPAESDSEGIVKLKITVINNSLSSAYGQIVCALYKDGYMVGIDIKPQQRTTAGDEIEAEAEIGCDEYDTIKVFVIENISHNFKPTFSDASLTITSENTEASE